MERNVSPEGSVKEFPLMRGYTIHVLVFARSHYSRARPHYSYLLGRTCHVLLGHAVCSAVVYLKELVMAESTHEAFHVMHVCTQKKNNEIG